MSDTFSTAMDYGNRESAAISNRFGRKRIPEDYLVIILAMAYAAGARDGANEAFEAMKHAFEKGE